MVFRHDIWLVCIPDAHICRLNQDWSRQNERARDNTMLKLPAGLLLPLSNPLSSTTILTTPTHIHDQTHKSRQDRSGDSSVENSQLLVPSSIWENDPNYDFADHAFNSMFPSLTNYKRKTLHHLYSAYIGRKILLLTKTAIHVLSALTEMPLTRISSFAPKCATRTRFVSL